MGLAISFGELTVSDAPSPLTRHSVRRRHASGVARRVYRAEDFAWAGLFLFFVATTISFATTSFASRVAIEVLRGCALLGMMGSLTFHLVLTARLRPITLIALGLMSLSVFYGLTLSALGGGLETSLQGLPLDLLLILIGIIALSLQDGAIVPKSMARALLRYSGFMLVLTIATGGVWFTIPPAFKFEYLSLVQDGLVRYSQGMSKFFGLAALCAVFLAFESNDIPERRKLYLFAVFFVLCSFLGGSRGDSLAIALILLGYTFYKAPHYMLYVIPMAIITPVLLSQVVDLENITIVSRLLALRDNLGMRDVLLKDAVGLLAQRPECLITGCGFDYFQTFHGYEAGLYPHNYLIESVIVLGTPFTVLLWVSALYGLWLLRRTHDATPDMFPLMFIFFSLVGLKGGSLLSDWVLTSSLFLLAAYAAVRHLRP